LGGSIPVAQNIEEALGPTLGQLIANNLINQAQALRLRHFRADPFAGGGSGLFPRHAVQPRCCGFIRTSGTLSMQWNFWVCSGN